MLNEADAIAIVASFETACDLANASIVPVTASLAPDDASAYKRLVGGFMGNAYLGVLRPLAAKFPGAGVPVYGASAIPASTDAITAAFLAHAGAAIASYRDLVEQGEADGTFRPGSLRDIEQARDALAAHFSAAG